jgi:hypothetical protein
MLVELVTVAAIVSHSESSKPHVRYAMAAALIAGSGEKRYEPPTEKEVKPPKDAVPQPGKLPAPVYGEERKTKLAQGVNNEELARRIDRLEEENRRLRSQSGVAPPQGSPPGARLAPSQMIPGCALRFTRGIPKARARSG